jgi:ATP-binding cassette, subfamily C (CFTR/MRP), member 1
VVVADGVLSGVDDSGVDGVGDGGWIEPTLFCGSVRSNVDPLGQHSDSIIWEALDRANIKGYFTSTGKGLDSPLDEAGGNLSAGQRQLVCLARAMLTGARIVLLDEATASVDMMNDQQVQLAIRSSLEECTVLTIAHRLHTVMDSDRIMVLDNGRVCEFDTPRALLGRTDGVLHSMWKEQSRGTSSRQR